MYVEFSIQNTSHELVVMLLFVFQVTHILNVAYGVENAFPDLFIYKTLSILDQPDTDIISYLQECTQFIEQAKAEVSFDTVL